MGRRVLGVCLLHGRVQTRARKGKAASYPRLVAPGVIVVGRYEPRSLDAEVMGKVLLRLTERAGLRSDGSGCWTHADWGDPASTAEVRSPESNARVAEELAQRWHRDGSNSDGGDLWIVLWSNREQTEIRTADGAAVALDPCDVVLIRNGSVEHRSPEKASPDRWFFRRLVQPPEWLGRLGCRF
jgi:hypothetical protein